MFATAGSLLREARAQTIQPATTPIQPQPETLATALSTPKTYVATPANPSFDENEIAQVARKVIQGANPTGKPRELEFNPTSELAKAKGPTTKTSRNPALLRHLQSVRIQHHLTNTCAQTFAAPTLTQPKQQPTAAREARKGWFNKIQETPVA